LTQLSGIWQLTKIHLSDVRRGRWFFITTGLYLVLLGIFVLVGFKESSILGFTGLSRVLINFSHAIVIVLPLLALMMTSQTVPSDRDNGTLEALMSHPIRRSHYFGGLVLSRNTALIGPFLLILGLVGIVGRFGFGQEIPWGYLGMTAAASSSLIFAFVGLGTGISVAARNQTRALIYGLLAWTASVALLDFVLIGLMLQWRLEPGTVFTLASINPVQTARFVLLTSVETDLNILGPVGFFMVNKVGPGWIKCLGLGWPLVFGSLALWFSWESFKRSDIV
jgi:ABC-type transport system involved in multi-copper enzyme maturation permease subunit